MANKTTRGGTRKRRTKFTLRIPECLERRELLAVFTVDTFSDTAAKNLVTGQDILGKVSLRGAVMAANSLGGSHTINLSDGTYTLTLIGPGEDGAATGDLDIKSNITLQGVSASTTIIDGSGNDRVFQVLGARTVNINQVTITNGSNSTGGGIWNQGTLTITDSILSKNVASGTDGSTLTFQGADGGKGASAFGGGIYNSPLGTLTLNGTTVTENIARGGNGGSGNEGRSGDSDNAFPGSGGTGGNGGAGLGGGIYNSGTLSILANSFFSLNEARGGNGGNGGKGGAGFAFDQGVSPGAAGGKGGNAGPGAGGGVYHAGAGKVLSIQSANFDQQKVNGGNGGSGGGGGSGGPGNSTFAPAGGGVGANGGTGANGTGGAVHNSGGTVNITQTTMRQATVHGGSGGAGGIGGFGGGVSAAASELGKYDGATGGNGGNGGNGGQSLGGGLHTTGGAVALDQQSNALLNIVAGTFGGAGGAGGFGSRGGNVPAAEFIYGTGGYGGKAGTSAGGSLAAGGGISATGGTLNIQAAGISQNLVTGGRGANGATGGIGGDGGPLRIPIEIIMAAGGASSPGGAGGAGKGGGLYVNNATVNVQTTLFFGNQAVGGGGGVGGTGSTDGGNLVTGDGGDALPGTLGGVGGSGQGGGISIGTGTISVTTSTFNSNSATGSVGGVGGKGGTGLAAVQGTQGQGGDAGQGMNGGVGGIGVGGGVAASTAGGTLNVSRSTFSNNEAAGRSGGNGGASGVVGQGVTFGTNRRGGSGGLGGNGLGGAFFASQGTLNLTNNTLDGNRAAGDNGGIGGVGQVANGNGSDGAAGLGRGGAGFHSGFGIVTLINNTITRNKISNFYGSDLGSGGGLVNESGTMNLLNNLIALNFYDSTIIGVGKQTKGTFTSQGTNLITNTDGSAGFITSDITGTGTGILNAKVDVLASNGGTTQTCKLLTGSAAINAGTTAGAPTADQRGTARNGKVDIGSYEV